MLLLRFDAGVEDVDFGCLLLCGKAAFFELLLAFGKLGLQLG